MKSLPCLVGLAGALALAAPAFVAAQAPSPAGESPASESPAGAKELIDAALKLTQSEAVKYEMMPAGEADSKLTLRKEPVLRWSNPTVGEIHGNVFLWTTADDRPAVVGSFFKWFSPHTHMSHEFHSLAEGPLTARYQEREVWHTSKGGLAFARLPESPQPAGSATRRYLQMRELAKRFSATKIERDGNQQELRLLPQPIYRYAAMETKVLDGGLFVFVQGTDPEVFLLLEARGEGDAARWQFAAARMNSVAFDVRFQDKPIWSVEVMPWSDVGGHAETYTTFMFKMP